MLSLLGALSICFLRTSTSSLDNIQRMSFYGKKIIEANVVVFIETLAGVSFRISSIPKISPASIK